MADRILIINPFGVGDVLFSTILISALKNSFSACYIGYISNIRTREILETNPHISEVFVFERDEYRKLWKASKLDCIKRFFNFWRQIKKRKFDIALDLSLGKEYAFLCWLVGIKERRGFDYKGRGRFLTHKVSFNGFNDKPVAEYYLELLSLYPSLSIPGGGECRSERKLILLATEKDKAYIDNFLKEQGVTEEDILVGIAPGGGISFGKKEQDRRRWGIRKFSELADRIIERYNIRIVLIWGPQEEYLVKEISGVMKHKALIAPRTSIRQMAALCKKCRMVICNEGGPLHIASSQGVKTVSIFGPVDEAVYGPYPPSRDNIIITSNVGCRPCYRRFKLPKCNTRVCLENISVDDVFGAVENVLHTSGLA